MTVYIAIDDANGMLFNNRRQSQDRIMRENMLRDCANSTLWIAEYSKIFFEDENGKPTPPNVVVDENHVHAAGDPHHELKVFDQLYGGGQGVYGCPTHTGVTVVYNNK